MAKFKVKDTTKMTPKQLSTYEELGRQWSLYGKSKAMYEGCIRSAIRKVWMLSEGRKQALIRCRKPNTGEGRHRFWETCERCGVKHKIGEKQFKLKVDGTLGKKKQTCLIVHHIQPMEDVFHKDFLTHMFCEQWNNPKDGYEVLCHKCHDSAHIEIEMLKRRIEK